MGKSASKQKYVEPDQQTVDLLLRFSRASYGKTLNEFCYTLIDATHKLEWKTDVRARMRLSDACVYYYEHQLRDVTDCLTPLTFELFDTHDGLAMMHLADMANWATQFEEEDTRTKGAIPQLKKIAEALREHRRVVLVIVARKKYEHDHAKEIAEENRLAKRRAEAIKMLQ